VGDVWFMGSVSLVKSDVLSCAFATGEADRCFLLARGGERSVGTLRLFTESLSALRSEVGVGSEVEGFFRTGEAALSCQ
jgi:hypothetical protein